jgi:hypothetical protein
VDLKPKLGLTDDESHKTALALEGAVPRCDEINHAGKLRTVASRKRHRIAADDAAAALAVNRSGNVAGSTP